MEAMDKGILLGLGQLLLYGALLVLWVVRGRQGAAWTKKLTVRITAVFAGIKALGGLVTGGMYFTQKLDLLGKTEETFLGLISYPETILSGATGIYLVAMLLLTFIFLGKVPRTPEN